MRILAVDPGKDGFIVGIDGAYGGKARVDAWPMPVVLMRNPRPGKDKDGNPKIQKKREYDHTGCSRILRDWKPDLMVVEKQAAFSPPGVKIGLASAFSIGVGFELWVAMASALMVPLRIVHPRTWQAAMLRDVQGTDTKQRALIAAQRLFPNVDMAAQKGRIRHNGKADALLMAMWALRT